MKHEPIPALDDMQERDAELTRLILRLPPCPGIPSTEAEVEAAVVAARADIAAGRVYSDEIVGQWIATIAGPNFKPFDDWLADRNA